jgi:F1F0 ATPase subunit 2
VTALLLLALGAVAGVAVGLLFFGGLWWTAQRLAVTDRPAVLTAASLLLRMGVLAAVLVVLARSDVLLLVGAVAGLVAARLGLTRAAVRGALPGRITPGTDGGR